MPRDPDVSYGGPPKLDWPISRYPQPKGVPIPRRGGVQAKQPGEERGGGAERPALVDFSQNTRGRNKYGLLVTDVFTREPGAAGEEPLGDNGLRKRVFSRARGALLEGVVHRQKDPSDRNATTLRKTLWGEMPGTAAGGRSTLTR